MATREMWRQVQVGSDSVQPWEEDPDNACGGCGRKTTASELIWIWADEHGAFEEYHGIRCAGCGPPQGAPHGETIGAGVALDRPDEQGMGGGDKGLR